MLFSQSLIVLIASLAAQGAVVAPNDFAAAPGGGMISNSPATPSATAALDATLASSNITDAATDDGERHPAPPACPIPLPNPGPSTGTGTGTGMPGGPVTSTAVVLVIKTVTTASDDLNNALGQLTTSLTLSSVTTISTSLIKGFTTIIANLAKAAATFPGTTAFGNDAAGAVVDVLVGFVRVHQALLATVIGKHSIFAQFGLTEPIAAVLRTLEAGVDAFALALINLIPTKRNTVQTQIASLDLTVKSSINTYSQICFPSPTYPKSKPTCIKTN